MNVVVKSTAPSALPERFDIVFRRLDEADKEMGQPFVFTVGNAFLQDLQSGTFQSFDLAAGIGANVPIKVMKSLSMT
jgi:hypothetical protein